MLAYSLAYIFGANCVYRAQGISGSSANTTQDNLPCEVTSETVPEKDYKLLMGWGQQSAGDTKPTKPREANG